MAAFLDNVGFVAAAGGTTDFQYSSVLAGGYQSPASGNIVNGKVYRYYAFNADRSLWEIGGGAYAAGTGTLARTTVLFNSSGTTAKINFAAAPNVVIVALAEDLPSLSEDNAFSGNNTVPTQALLNNSTRMASTAYVDRTTREKLTNHRALYVNASTGSDTLYDGQSPTVSGTTGPFATIQKAVDAAASLDLVTFNVNITAAAGTYAAVLCKQCIGAGAVSITGDPTTPANCIINAANYPISTPRGCTTFYSFNGFRVASSGFNDVNNAQGSYMSLQNMEYNGTSTTNHRIWNSGYLQLIGAHKITSTVGVSWLLTDGGRTESFSPTVALGASPTYGAAFTIVRWGGIFICAGMSFSLGGFSVTGPRHLVDGLAMTVGTGGVGTFFPGSSTPSPLAVNGGQFN